MRRSLYLRQLALAGAALLGVVGALAAGALMRPDRSLPRALGSYTALAGPNLTPSGAPRLSSCRVRIEPDTEGIENPVLPCGVRLYLHYRGRTVLARIIGSGPTPAGREFSLTEALARKLGLFAVRRVSWSYAEASPGP